MSYLKNIQQEYIILPPINIRDLIEFKNKRKPIDINEVEPIEEILKRFGSGSMSMVLYQQKLMKL